MSRSIIFHALWLPLSSVVTLILVGHRHQVLAILWVALAVGIAARLEAWLAE